MDAKNEITESTTTAISKWDVFSKISGLAFPMGLSFTFSFEVVFAVIMLNMLSENTQDSAAATLVSTFMNTVCVLGGSPLFSVAMLLSKKLGEWKESNNTPQTDKEQQKLVISSFNVNALRVAAWVTPPAFLALFFSETLLTSVFQQNGNIAHQAQNFLRIYAFAIPGIFARAAFEQIMFAFGKTTPAMVIGLTNLGLGTLLATCLGFGVGSIPKLGAQGVAAGFLIEAYLTGVCYGLYVLLHPECREFEFFSHMLQKMRQTPEVRKSIFNVGGSIAFTMLIELSLLLTVGIYSGLIGSTEQAAMSYSLQFIYFESLFLAAFSFSCAQEMGRELGAKQYTNASRIGRYGLLTSVFFLAPIPVIVSSAPQLLLITDKNIDHNILSILTHLVPIMSAGVLMDIVRYNLLQQLRVLGDLTVPNTIAVSGMSIGIILSAILGLKTSLKIDGVAAGYAIGIGLSALGLLLRWKDQVGASHIGQVQHSNSMRNCCARFFKEKPNKNEHEQPLLGNDNQFENNNV